MADVMGTKFAYPECYNWSIEQQIIDRGYLFEEHKIQTEDGYILTAYRIPGRKDQADDDIKKQPIILQHGLLDMGGTWLFNNPSLDLPFELVD